MTQGSRVLGAAMVLLLVGVLLSACGAAPVAQNWPGLTLDGNTIYVISGTPQQVVMLDAETGAQTGTFLPRDQLKGTPYWSPVTIGGGLAFVGFAESVAKIAALLAFDPATGQELWRIPAESLILPAPVYADGVVYFGASDGQVYAVDVETKSVKPGWPFQAEDAVWGSPLVADGRVYVAAMDHHVYCLDAETGKLIWKQQVGGAMAAQPTLDPERGLLYVGAFDGKAYAIQADSGELVDGFEFKAGNWIWSKVLLDGDQIFLTSLDGKLYALDPISGAVLPPYPYDSAEATGKADTLRASPVQSPAPSEASEGDSIIVATESGRVIAVKNALRQWVWTSGVAQPPGSALTTPVVADDRVYVVLLNGQVQSLDAQTGNQIWTFSPPESK